jgi:hypothetical protein
MQRFFFIWTNESRSLFLSSGQYPLSELLEPEVSGSWPGWPCRFFHVRLPGNNIHTMNVSFPNVLKEPQLFLFGLAPCAAARMSDSEDEELLQVRFTHFASSKKSSRGFSEMDRNDPLKSPSELLCAQPRAPPLLHRNGTDEAFVFCVFRPYATHSIRLSCWGMAQSARHQ